MGEKEEIKREPGYLYYVGKDGYIWAAPLKSNPSGRKKRVGTKRVPVKAECKRIFDENGYTARAKIKE